MVTFLKAQAASVIGSVADFVVYAMLVKLTAETPLLVSIATAVGAIAGGIVNFVISRKWVFNEGQKRPHIQAMRYVLVWVGSILLNSSGMYLITYFTNLNFIVARLLVGITIGVTYNYTLQKSFVFK